MKHFRYDLSTPTNLAPGQHCIISKIWYLTKYYLMHCWIIFSFSGNYVPVRVETDLVTGLGWVFSYSDTGDRLIGSAVKRSIGSTSGCTITEKAPTRAFSWLKAATTAFTFKTLLRHYAKRALTPRSLNVKLGSRAIVMRDGRLWDTMLSNLPVPYDLCVSDACLA